jgi:hypothetical protein
MSEQSELIKYYVEALKDSRWQTVDTFGDDARALKGLVAARNAEPKFRYRVSDSTAKVHLDVPPVGAS